MAAESVNVQGENDADFLRHQAHVQELNEAWPKAIACWERVMKVDPNDLNARRRANDLSAKATIHKSGLNEAIQKAERGNSAAEQMASELEDMKRNALTSEQRHLKDIAENPKHIGAISHSPMSIGTKDGLTRRNKSSPRASRLCRTISTSSKRMPTFSSSACSVRSRRSPAR